MSLIGDALRKARREAADRESDRQGILFSAKIADSPTRSNLGLGLLLGAIIAVVATVAGGGAVWWVLGRSTSPEPAGITAKSAAPVNTPAAEPEPVANDDDGGDGDGGGGGGGDDGGGDGGDGGGTNGGDGSSDGGGDSGEDGASHVPAASRPQEPKIPNTGIVGTEDGKEIYILEADLGTVRLSLDFLVSRAEDPFAEINGVELHLGGVIEGFRVKSIESDQVTLSNGRRTIVLRAP